jgi:hypothetical protein
MTAFLCIVTFVFAQSTTLHGTLVLIQADSNRIIVAADSRRRSGPGEFTDSACKINVLGPHMFFTAAGDVALTHVDHGRDIIVYDAHEFAKTVFKTHQMSTAHEIAGLWSELIRRRLQRAINATPKSFGTYTPKFQAVFASTSSTELHIYRMEVAVKKSKTGSGVVSVEQKSFLMPPNEPTMYLGGEALPDVVEFLQNQTPRAVEANKHLRGDIADNPDRDAVALRMQFAIQYAADWSTSKDTVGGPVDILELTHKGNRWIAVKNECKNQN